MFQKKKDFYSELESLKLWNSGTATELVYRTLL